MHRFVSGILVAFVASVAPVSAVAQFVREPDLATRLNNLPTYKVLQPGVLQVLFVHRFTQTVQDGGFDDLWGLDSAADIGLGLEYGVGRGIQLEIFRSSFLKQWEAAMRWSAVRQGERRWPVSMALRAGGSYRSADGITDRGSGYLQAVVGRRTGQFNLMLMPAFISDTPTLRNAFNIGVGIIWHLPRGWDIYLEGMPPNHDAKGAAAAWSVGFDKQIGGHDFTIYIGNSRAEVTDIIYGSDLPGGFKASDLRLGFNILRRFPG